VLVMLVALVAGAADKFVIALPNGYEMARTKVGAAQISKRRGKVVVPGPIKSYTVVREVVVGQLDVPEPNDGKGDGSSNAAPAADASQSAATATPPAGSPPPAAAAAGAPSGAAPAPAPAAGAPAGGANGGAPGAAQGGGMGPPGAGGGGRPGGGRPGATAEKPANPVFARPPPAPNGRYFVLDTKTGEVGKDLSLPEWEERLKKLDITTAPALAAPILPK
jgi:hypothetical protein